MKKSTKGALAAAAAAALLVGGAGSFAYWSAQQTVPGLSVDAGSLTLSTPDCDDGWLFDGGETAPGTPFAGQPLVPGDILSQTCTATVAATGEHLRATLDVMPGATSGDLFSSGAAAFASTATLNGTPLAADTEITNETVGAGALVVTMSVTFLGGAVGDNSSQLDAGTLADYTIRLDQVHTPVTAP